MSDTTTPELQFIRNRSASGGVNTLMFPYDISDTQAVELTNIDTTTPGIRKSRPGVALIASGITFGPIMALSAYQAISAESELLAVSPGATYPNSGHLKLWSFDGTATTWSLKGTLTGLTSATMPVQIVVGMDLQSVSGKPYLARIFSAQQQSVSFVYDGSSLGATSGGAVVPGMFPAANMLNRCFASSLATTSRGRVFFTAPAQFGYTGWAASSAQNVVMGGGFRQVVVAIHPFRNSDNIIFMADRIEAIQVFDPSLDTVAGSPLMDWNRVVIDTSIGCASQRGIASSGEDLLFADQYGNIRSLARTITDSQQGVTSLPLSAPLKTYIDRINPVALSKIVAQFHDRSVYFSFPLDTATEPSHTFRWDVVNESWDGPYTGLFPAKSMAVCTMSNPSASSKYQNPGLYLGAGTTTGGMVFHAEDGTSDAGLPIVFQETTKRYAGDGLEFPKFFRRIKDFYQATGSETMMVESRKDGGSYNILGYIDLTGDSPTLPLTFPFNFGGNGVVSSSFSLESFGERCQDVQFRFTCTATSEVRHLGFTTAFHNKNFEWKVG